MSQISHGTITITDLTDKHIDSVYWFYKAQTDTVPPTKEHIQAPTYANKGTPPTDDTGIGAWSALEPTDITLESQVIYVVILTYFSDETCDISEVSRYSSFAAATQAYMQSLQEREYAIQGTPYYQYTSGGITYDVIRNGDVYYYLDENNVQHFVSETDLDVVLDDEQNYVPVIVYKDGVYQSLDDVLIQLENFKNDNANEFSNVDEALSGLQIQYLNLNENFGNHNKDINDLKDLTKDYSGYININPGASTITLGNSDSDYVVEITSTNINFKYKGNVLAYASGTQFVAPTGVFTELAMQVKKNDNTSIGDLRWIARTNGHLSLKVVK